MSDVTYEVDGDMICCYRIDTFINLQESVAGFGDTEEKAYQDLLDNEPE